MHAGGVKVKKKKFGRGRNSGDLLLINYYYKITNSTEKKKIVLKIFNFVCSEDKGRAEILVWGNLEDWLFNYCYNKVKNSANCNQHYMMF